MKKIILYLLFPLYCICNSGCHWFEVRVVQDGDSDGDSLVTMDSATAKQDSPNPVIDTITQVIPAPIDQTKNRDTVLVPPTKAVNTGQVQPDSVVGFAKTLEGTPYVYASTNPAVGFDCSGFITYVFNHFKIAVPRSSVDFTNVGKTVEPAEAKAGDLILFTGTDSTERVIGHMGLVISNNAGELEFIHSSSGKAMGVTVTPLNQYYRSRFVRVARIFPQNDLL